MNTPDSIGMLPSGSELNDEALKLMLQALEDNEDRASFDLLVKTVQQRWAGNSQPLPEADELQRILLRDGISRGYVLPSGPKTNIWELLDAGRDYLQSISTEIEETLGNAQVNVGLSDTASETVTSPYNPAYIKVDNQQMLVFQLMRKIRKGEIILDPDFQRNFIWDEPRQSQLIESILLHIPLPAFYLDATHEDKWIVVDGLQRLTTLDKFYNKKQLRLSGLEYLKDLNGKTYDEIPRSLQRVIEDYTRFTVYLILPETPSNVKFMIFRRVNTGGLTLTAQEIRHALYHGAATQLLKALAATPEFLQATGESVSPRRMDDRECVLRFIAFHQNQYEQFGMRIREGEPANLDSLLNQTMVDLNSSSAASLEQLKAIFCESMVKAKTVFGSYAFRKMYSRYGRHYPISKPLFEVWSVLLTRYALDQLKKHNNAIVDAFIALMSSDQDFLAAISLGTGSRRTVIERFGKIQRLLQEVLG